MNPKVAGIGPGFDAPSQWRVNGSKRYECELIIVDMDDFEMSFSNERIWKFELNRFEWMQVDDLAVAKWSQSGLEDGPGPLAGHICVGGFKKDAMMTVEYVGVHGGALERGTQGNGVKGWRLNSPATSIM